MNGNRHFLRFFNSNSHSHSCNFFFGIAIPIPILILELGFHESTTELGQLLISAFYPIFDLFRYFLYFNQFLRLFFPFEMRIITCIQKAKMDLIKNLWALKVVVNIFKPNFPIYLRNFIESEGYFNRKNETNIVVY